MSVWQKSAIYLLLLTLAVPVWPQASSSCHDGSGPGLSSTASTSEAYAHHPQPDSAAAVHAHSDHTLIQSIAPPQVSADGASADGCECCETCEVLCLVSAAVPALDSATSSCIGSARPPAVTGYAPAQHDAGFDDPLFRPPICP